MRGMWYSGWSPVCPLESSHSLCELLGWRGSGALELESGCTVLPLLCSPHQLLHSALPTDHPVPRVTLSQPEL